MDVNVVMDSVVGNVLMVRDDSGFVMVVNVLPRILLPLEPFPLVFIIITTFDLFQFEFLLFPFSAIIYKVAPNAMAFPV